MTFPVLVLFLVHVLLGFGRTKRGRERRPPVAPRVRPEDAAVRWVSPTTWSEQALERFSRSRR